MKTLMEHLFEFSYQTPWSDDTELENTSVYLFLKEQTLKLQPNRDYYHRYSSFLCALNILAIEFIREDENGFPDASIVKDELQKKVEALSSADYCTLSDYFGLYKKLKPDKSDTNYFLTADDKERINFHTVNLQITNYLLSEIEIELARLKSYLMYTIPKDRWYLLYNAVDAYDKDRIDMIVKSILE